MNGGEETVDLLLLRLVLGSIKEVLVRKLGLIIFFIRKLIDLYKYVFIFPEWKKSLAGFGHLLK